MHVINALNDNLPDKAKQTMTGMNTFKKSDFCKKLIQKTNATKSNGYLSADLFRNISTKLYGINTVVKIVLKYSKADSKPLRPLKKSPRC